MDPVELGADIVKMPQKHLDMDARLKPVRNWSPA